MRACCDISLQFIFLKLANNNNDIILPYSCSFPFELLHFTFTYEKSSYPMCIPLIRLDFAWLLEQT